MPRPSPDRAARWAAVVSLSLAAAPACRKSEPDAPPPPSPPARSAGAGVKVPIPEGWVATAANEGALLLGPPGRPVLRIDVRAGGKLPSAEDLEGELRRALPNARVTDVDRESRGDVTLVVVSLVRSAPEPGNPLVVLLGAKRLGTDLYLCASTPDATPDEVKLAAGACREIHRPGA
jgi:hypothetical protein